MVASVDLGAALASVSAPAGLSPLRWAVMWCAVAAVVGAAFGSFTGVVIERGVRRAVSGERSHCACGRALRAWENVPLAGFLSTAGTARCCGAKLPWWYLHVEVAGFVVGAVSALGVLVGRPVLSAAAVCVFIVDVVRRRRRFRQVP